MEVHSFKVLTVAGDPSTVHSLRELSMEAVTKGAELVDVLMVMVAWGDRWLAGKVGPPILCRHRGCGHSAVAWGLAGGRMRVGLVRDHPLRPGPWPAGPVPAHPYLVQ
jgi:hypothetical protein